MSRRATSLPLAAGGRGWGRARAPAPSGHTAGTTPTPPPVTPSCHAWPHLPDARRRGGMDGVAGGVVGVWGVHTGGGRGEGARVRRGDIRLHFRRQTYKRIFQTVGMFKSNVRAKVFCRRYFRSCFGTIVLHTSSCRIFPPGRRTRVPIPVQNQPINFTHEDCKHLSDVL